MTEHSGSAIRRSAKLTFVIQLSIVLVALLLWSRGSHADEALTPTPAGPVVYLIPGSGSSGPDIYLDGIGGILKATIGDSYFGTFQKRLAEEGVPSMVCPKTQDGDSRTLEEREEECAQMILEERGGCPGGGPRTVILLGHSMGGLIARELAADPRVGGCIQSVTTVSTPHRGSAIADLVETHDLTKWYDPTSWAIGLLRFTPEHRHYLPEMAASREGKNPALFRGQDTPDNPAVEYFSVTNSMGFIPVLPLEITRHMIRGELKELGLSREETLNGANDGIVPEYSMAYGRVLGHLNVYHWASACVDPVAWTPECKATLALVIPHLVGKARDIEQSLPPSY